MSKLIEVADVTD